MWYNCFLKRTKLIDEIPLAFLSTPNLCMTKTAVGEVSTDNSIHYNKHRYT